MPRAALARAPIMSLSSHIGLASSALSRALAFAVCVAARALRRTNPRFGRRRDIRQVCGSYSILARGPISGCETQEPVAATDIP